MTSAASSLRPSACPTISIWVCHGVVHGCSGNATTGAILLSFLYSASVMPELVAKMTSGWASATSSIGAPSASSYRTGASAPGSSISASNQSLEPPALPPQVSLVDATGTTPRASALSWSVQPSVATRCGSSSIVVSPKACSMVTGKASASTSVLAWASTWSVVEPVEQAASSGPARAAVSAAASAVRRVDMVLLEVR